MVRGDAALPRFGLTEDAFAALAARVGLVFHNAAKLDFIASYGALRGANVGSAHAVLDLAVAGRPKLVAHTSSISVIESPACPAPRVAEDAPLDFPETLAIGYAQSKWVAEAIMARARGRGFAVSVFRPSWIIGPEAGIVAGDFVARFIEGCRRIGALPDSGYRWDLVPADYVAKAIVTLTLSDRCREPVYHVGAARPLSVPALVSRLDALGAALSIVPVDEWRERLRQALASDAENPLRPVGSLFLRDSRGDAAADNYLLARVPEMDSRRTRRRLRRLGIADAVVDDQLLASLLRSGRRAAEQLSAAAE
jgi:thioester reductase-like protein